MTANNSFPFQVRELLERLNDYRSLGDKRSFEKYARQGELDGGRNLFVHWKNMEVLLMLCPHKKKTPVVAQTKLV